MSFGAGHTGARTSGHGYVSAGSTIRDVGVHMYTTECRYDYRLTDINMSNR